jgi:hypothetical protein
MMVTAVLVAAPVGLAVALGAGLILDMQLLGTWGILYGVLAFIAAFGLTLIAIGRRHQRRIGMVALALSAAAVSAGAWFFVIGWGISLVSLEGAWLWPLAILSTVVALASLFKATRAP